MITYGKEKNELLKQNRGIGFEEIISAIDAGKVLDVYDHPDQINYFGQKIYVLTLRTQAKICSIIMGQIFKKSYR